MKKAVAKKVTKTPPKAHVIRRQTFSIDVIEFSDGTCEKQVDCKGFAQYEIVGLLTCELKDFLSYSGEEDFKNKK